jgi:hypothetical protein
MISFSLQNSLTTVNIRNVPQDQRGSKCGGETRQNKTPLSESASELYPPSDRRLSVELVPTLEDRGLRVVSVTDPHGRILGFLDRSC